MNREQSWIVAAGGPIVKPSAIGPERQAAPNVGRQWGIREFDGVGV